MPGAQQWLLSSQRGQFPRPWKKKFNLSAFLDFKLKHKEQKNTNRQTNNIIFLSNLSSFSNSSTLSHQSFCNISNSSYDSHFTSTYSAIWVTMETRERENAEIRVVNQTENQITRRAQKNSSSESVSARGRREELGCCGSFTTTGLRLRLTPVKRQRAGADSVPSTTAESCLTGRRRRFLPLPWRPLCHKWT